MMKVLVAELPLRCQRDQQVWETAPRSKSCDERMEQGLILEKEWGSTSLSTAPRHLLGMGLSSVYLRTMAVL